MTKSGTTESHAEIADEPFLQPLLESTVGRGLPPKTIVIRWTISGSKTNIP